MACAAGFIGAAKVTVTYTGIPSPTDSVLLISDPNWETELAAGKPWGAAVYTFGHSAMSTDPHTIITAADAVSSPKGIWVAWKPVRLHDPTTVHALVPHC